MVRQKFLINKYIKQLLTVLCVLLIISPVYIAAEILERVVAIVDDEVVLLSEFEESVRLAEEAGERLSEELIINQIINKIILLREARKIGLIKNSENQEDESSIINEFVDKRIKAFIHIPYREIEHYFESNEFEGKELYDVKDEIEKLIVSKELVKRLREYIEEQRKKSYVRIQLKE